MEKKCANCEYYSCQREVTNGLFGPTVKCSYNAKNKCLQTNKLISSPSFRCNCWKFSVWSKLESEIEKEKLKKQKCKNNDNIPTPVFPETISSTSGSNLESVSIKPEMVEEIQNNIIKQKKKTRKAAIIIASIIVVAFALIAILLIF